MYNLRNRSFLKELDFEPAELRFLLQLAAALKTAKYAGNEAPRLGGKEIASGVREDLDPHPGRLRGRRP